MKKTQFAYANLPSLVCASCMCQLMHSVASFQAAALSSVTVPRALALGWHLAQW